MKKNKVHDIAAELGYKTNEDFYKDFPTEDIYKAYCNGGKIGMKTGGNIKPPKKEISLSGGLFGASKFANKKGGWDSLNDPNSYMTANGKVNYFAPLNKNSNAFFKGSVGTADFLTRLEPENYLQRDNNGNLTYNVAPEGYENENDFIASARLGMQTPQKKKFNRFTDRGEISAGLDYANGNIYPGAGFNYSADYNFRRRNSLPNTQYNKTAGSVGVYGDVNIAPVGIGKEQFENYAGTDSSSEFNQAMRTNLGVKAQYNFPKNGFFVRGNAEVNPLITNFKDGIKTLPSAQLTIGQRFNNGGNIKSRLPKYQNAGIINDPLTKLTNEQVLANMAPGGDSLQGINQSLGFYKTPGNAPIKTPGTFNPYGALYQAAGDLASQSIDTLSPDQNIEGQNYDTAGEIFGKNITKFAGIGAGIGAGFGGVGALIGGAAGAIVGTGKSFLDNTQNNAQILNAKFQGKAARDRRQRSVTNNDPYGLASSYNISGYADGGEMVPLNSNTEQVEGDEPQVVDGVVKRDDRTGQPVAMVNDKEIIKDGQQVFSDEKKISKKAGLTRTFAKTAEILAKQKGKLETQLEKRGGEDVYTANAIKAVDRQMNTLFGLQERTATQMGLREPAPQQAMAMRSGGNLRGYANGGGQPFGVFTANQNAPWTYPEINNLLFDDTYSLPPSTKDSVTKFQQAYNKNYPYNTPLVVDGIYGKNTAKVFNDHGQSIYDNIKRGFPVRDNNSGYKGFRPELNTQSLNSQKQLGSNLNEPFVPPTAVERSEPLNINFPGKQKNEYDLDENYIISSLGNLRAAIPFMKYDRERAVFDPNESRTANYINNMPTNTNIRASLNEIDKQRRLMQLQASQNSPTIAAAVNSNIFSAAVDSEMKLRQDADNLNNEKRERKAIMQTENSRYAGGKRQEAILKADEATAMNKGITQTNYSAVMGKQAENTQKAWNTKQNMDVLNDFFSTQGISSGIFKTSRIMQDPVKMQILYENLFNGTLNYDEVKQGAKKTDQRTFNSSYRKYLESKGLTDDEIDEALFND